MNNQMNSQPDGSMPGVTAGIPFHGGIAAAHLRLAIDSILNQTVPAQQIHLIQDGPVSSELSKLAAAYAAAHPNVSYLLIPCNSGLPHALNLSILAAPTRYYARMDADDLAYPERLARQLEFLEQHPEIDILGTWAVEFTGDHFSGGGTLKKMPTDRPGIAAMFHSRDPFIHPSVVFRRSVFARIGLYDTAFLTNQDTELWARALKKKVGVANLPEPLLYFRAEGMIKKRAGFKAVLRLVRARYRFHTWSPRYNLLKVAALLFRFLPHSVQAWGYRNLR